VAASSCAWGGHKQHNAVEELFRLLYEALYSFGHIEGKVYDIHELADSG